jgi:hypothetical protein
MPTCLRDGCNDDAANGVPILARQWLKDLCPPDCHSVLLRQGEHAVLANHVIQAYDNQRRIGAIKHRPETWNPPRVALRRQPPGQLPIAVREPLDFGSRPLGSANRSVIIDTSARLGTGKYLVQRVSNELDFQNGREASQCNTSVMTPT